MSLEEIREQNIKLVVEKALYCFREHGIEKTKVMDIAKAAGLTERSIFRYFETKADIVQAAAYLFWSQTLERVSGEVKAADIGEMSGIDQVRKLLSVYSNLYFDDPKGIRFTLDAEVALYNAGKSLGRDKQVINRPPEPYEISSSPLVLAIHKGLEDGTVNPKGDVKELYYNAYDSILGVMQRIALGTTSATDLDNRARMRNLCEMFVMAFQGG
ncbi:MAG: helix-turn-helix transcriptional regulator [Clostridiales bacterium]|jgi:hypothetical protein|nr:helix-turn-helix transcriptional regulator [Clostridiales bacterium]